MSPDPTRRWQKTDSGTRYRGARWKNARRANRDPRIVASTLAQEGGANALVLDAPCGTGRLREAIEGSGARWVGIDVSAEMLAAHEDAARSRVRADVGRLPCDDRTFDAVVCCRLLHHLRNADVFQGVVNELVRVSRTLVIASFWDASSLPARRRRLQPRKQEGRIAHSKSHLREVFHTAGAEVIGWRHSMRFFSRQCFVVARRRERGSRGEGR